MWRHRVREPCRAAVRAAEPSSTAARRRHLGGGGVRDDRGDRAARNPAGGGAAWAQRGGDRARPAGATDVADAEGGGVPGAGDRSQRPPGGPRVATGGGRGGDERTGRRGD